MNAKCPDRQLLSVYFDGELPSPWKEKMESHIAGCSRCARRLQAYRGMSLPVDAAAAESARQRVWQKLERGAGTRFFRPAPVPQAMWRRRVSVPLPAAAAIALFIAAAFFLALRIAGTAQPDMALSSGTDFDAPGIIPVSDMEDVLQYLGSRDDGELIVIRLPESRNFANYGDPAIIRAADYSRRTNRQMTGRHIRNMPEGRKP